MDNFQNRRVCILVKAYPQPSQKYQETVCVAAVTAAHELVRIYPIGNMVLPKPPSTRWWSSTSSGHQG